MEKHLTLPLSEKDINELSVGDIVYLSGEVIQLLSPAHKRALEYKREGKELPFDLKDMAIYHCYTSLSETQCGLNCNFMGASTSAGVNPYEPDFIREFKIRAIVGKGGMDQATLEAMQEVGCVYLAQIGGCCQLVTEAVVRVKERFWEDLAANLGIKIEFSDLGPLIVGMDANGNSIYRDMQVKINEKKQELYKKIGVAK